MEGVNPDMEERSSTTNNSDHSKTKSAKKVVKINRDFIHGSGMSAGMSRSRVHAPGPIEMQTGDSMGEPWERPEQSPLVQKSEVIAPTRQHENSSAPLSFISPTRGSRLSSTQTNSVGGSAVEGADGQAAAANLREDETSPPCAVNKEREQEGGSHDKDVSMAADSELKGPVVRRLFPARGDEQVHAAAKLAHGDEEGIGQVVEAEPEAAVKSAAGGDGSEGTQAVSFMEATTSVEWDPATSSSPASDVWSERRFRPSPLQSSRCLVPTQSVNQHRENGPNPSATTHTRSLRRQSAPSTDESPSTNGPQEREEPAVRTTRARTRHQLQQPATSPPTNRDQPNKPKMEPEPEPEVRPTTFISAAYDNASTSKVRTRRSTRQKNEEDKWGRKEEEEKEAATQAARTVLRQNGNKTGVVSLVPIEATFSGHGLQWTDELVARMHKVAPDVFGTKEYVSVHPTEAQLKELRQRMKVKHLNEKHLHGRLKRLRKRLLEEERERLKTEREKAMKKKKDEASVDKEKERGVREKAMKKKREEERKAKKGREVREKDMKKKREEERVNKTKKEREERLMEMGKAKEKARLKKAQKEREEQEEREREREREERERDAKQKRERRAIRAAKIAARNAPPPPPPPPPSVPATSHEAVHTGDSAGGGGLDRAERDPIDGAKTEIATHEGGSDMELEVGESDPRVEENQKAKSKLQSHIRRHMEEEWRMETTGGDVPPALTRMANKRSTRRSAIATNEGECTSAEWKPRASIDDFGAYELVPWMCNSCGKHHSTDRWMASVFCRGCHAKRRSGYTPEKPTRSAVDDGDVTVASVGGCGADTDMVESPLVVGEIVIPRFAPTALEETRPSTPCTSPNSLVEPPRRRKRKERIAEGESLNASANGRCRSQSESREQRKSRKHCGSHCTSQSASRRLDMDAVTACGFVASRSQPSKNEAPDVVAALDVAGDGDGHCDGGGDGHCDGGGDGGETEEPKAEEARMEDADLSTPVLGPVNDVDMGDDAMGCDGCGNDAAVNGNDLTGSCKTGEDGIDDDHVRVISPAKTKAQSTVATSPPAPTAKSPSTKRRCKSSKSASSPSGRRKKQVHRRSRSEGATGVDVLRMAAEQAKSSGQGHAREEVEGGDDNAVALMEGADVSMHEQSEREEEIVEKNNEQDVGFEGSERAGVVDTNMEEDDAVETVMEEPAASPSSNRSGYCERKTQRESKKDGGSDAARRDEEEMGEDDSQGGGGGGGGDGDGDDDDDDDDSKGRRPTEMSDGDTEETSEGESDEEKEDDVDMGDEDSDEDDGGEPKEEAKMVLGGESADLDEDALSGPNEDGNEEMNEDPALADDDHGGDDRRKELAVFGGDATTAAQTDAASTTTSTTLTSKGKTALHTDDISGRRGSVTRTSTVSSGCGYSSRTHYTPCEGLPGVEVGKKVGEGTFAEVLKAKREDGTFVALKRLYQFSAPSRVVNELQCLKLLGGHNLVPKLLGGSVHEGTTTIVMEYFHHDNFKKYITKMPVEEIRVYMYKLLLSLKHIHEHGIIHRDVKPSNCLFSRGTQEFRLVDFGLAEQDNANVASVCKPLSKQATGGSGKETSTTTHVVSKAVPSHDINPQPSTSGKENANPKVHRSKPSVVETRKPTSSSHKKRREQPSSSSVVAMGGRQQPQHYRHHKSLHGRHSTSVSHQTKAVLPTLYSRSVDDARPLPPANRAGTRGYRAPEVLMKSVKQTVAIDVWSAGAIMLSLLSRRYPVFDAHDDLQNLEELTQLFGTDKMKETADSIGKLFTRSEPVQPTPLKEVCSSPNIPYTLGDSIPDEAYDLLDKLLEPVPSLRITANDALVHPFFLSVVDSEPKAQ